MVVLWCENEHDHVMAPKQARRLKAEPCCWCRAPIVGIDLHAVPSWDQEAVAAMIGVNARVEDGLDH